MSNLHWGERDTEMFYSGINVSTAISEKNVYIIDPKCYRKQYQKYIKYNVTDSQT